MGRLKVIKVSRGISTVLWMKSGNQGNRWYRHSINVQNAIPYKVKGMKITLTTYQTFRKNSLELIELYSLEHRFHSVVVVHSHWMNKESSNGPY